MSDVAQASERRQDRLLAEEIDKRLDLLLENYQKVTADPRKMGYLRFLLRHYGKDPHPFTKCCFPADTPIDCPRDHEKFPDGVPISQIAFGQLVWSFNLDLHVFELKPVVWRERTRTDAQLAMLTLDDGAQIKATPDHRFMMRDGSWVELQDLRAGDSLMPFYRDYLPMVRLSPDRVQWVTEHEQVARARHGDEDRKGKHIHHADERRANTDPENLDLLSSSDHVRRHHETAREMLAARNEMRKCRYCHKLFTPRHRTHVTCGECPDSIGYVKVYVGTERVCVCGTEFVAQAANHKYCSAKCREDNSVRGKRRHQDCIVCGVNFRTRQGNARHCVDCAPPRREPTKQTMTQLRVCANCGGEFKPTSGRQKHCSVECRSTFNNRLYAERNPGASIRNHRVVSVVLLDEYQDVWDIEVEDNHSFVVMGIVAHNCSDNMKRFGPGKTEGLCATLKDIIRQNVHWRHGPPKGPHPGHPDAGAPGAAIGEADAWAAQPAWHGGSGNHLSETRELSLLDELDATFGVVDHCEAIVEAFTVLEDIEKRCDPYRVLVGLDAAPTFEEAV